jgi:hypothetical protein
MKTGGETPDIARAAWPLGARILTWIVTAALAMFAAVCVGELAISLAWLVVGSNGHWRDRSTGHALVIGCLLGLLLLTSIAVTARSGVIVRGAAAAASGGLFVLGLSSVPTALGGLKPSCVVVHWSQAAFTREVLDVLEMDAAAPVAMELLYSDDHWHHFRLVDGRHMEVPRERVVALETCRSDDAPRY